MNKVFPLIPPISAFISSKISIFNVVSFVLCISNSQFRNNQATPVISPISGIGSGRPMENAYLFAAGSNPTGMPALSIANNMKTSQFVQQQPQHQQIPSIISLDPTKFLINAKPVVCPY